MTPRPPGRIFLSVQSISHRRPAGADPFTFRESRPLRFRASWWTRGTSTELYRSKVVPREEEAVRLARRWLERENKDGVRWIDTTDQPGRYGYAHPPIAESHATKKSAKAAKATSVKLTNPKDWQWVRSAAEGNEHAQERLADLLGWSGDNGHRGIVREQGEDYAVVDVEIDGSVYGSYKVR